MNTTADVLRRAKELLSDEGRWNNSGGFAVNANGDRAEGGTDMPGAVKWCAVGAIAAQRADGLGTDFASDPAVDALRRTIGTRTWIGITMWNDSSATHADVIDAFDRALLLVAQEAPVAA